MSGESPPQSTQTDCADSAPHCWQYKGSPIAGTSYNGTHSIGSTTASGNCTRTIAANTTTIPSTCPARMLSPSAMAALMMEITGSEQLTTIARVGSRCCNPAKYNENGASTETTAN